MKKETLQAIAALLIATILTGFGVVLFLQANLGSDTITVFLDGFKKIFDVSLGSASRVYNISALLLAMALSRKDIGWTSIVYALSTGFVMDFFNPILLPFDFAHASMLVRLSLIVIGQACIVFSFALLIRFGSGMDQLDAISYGICRRLPIRFAFIRTFLDILLLASGYFMGGVIGVGSIFAMATTGIGIDYVLKTKWLSNNTDKTKKGMYHEELA